MSCKSCLVCQNLFKQFQQHISTVHILTGTEGILGNVILNLLTLLISEGHSDELKDVQHVNRTVPVIAKPPDKHILRNNSGQEVKKSATIPSFSGDFSGNVLASSLIPISVNNKVREVNPLKGMPSIPQNLVEFPLIASQNNVLQNESLNTNSLINNDGTLTPMGLLLLSNQSNRESGKSDHDDVADILVNKMPIPSLKGLESSNLQTFYLQQLALSQLQQDITDESMLIADQNTQNSTNLQKKHDTFSTNHLTGDKNFTSFENILERHKHINERIVEMNLKNGKNEETQQPSSSKQAQRYIHHDPNVLTISSPGMPTIKPNIVIKPNISHTMPTTSLLNKQRMNILTSENSKRSMTPVLLSTSDQSYFSSQLSSQSSSPSSSSGDNDDTETETSSVHFTKEKKKEQAIINLQSLQNIIMETTKRIQEGFPTLKLPDDMASQNINVAIASSIPKVPVTTLQGLIINPTINQCKEEIPEGSNSRGREEEMEEVRDYSADNNIFVKPLLYKCDVCSVTFSVQQTLQAHIKTAHKEKVEFCNYCQLSFKSTEDYYIHVSSHHQGNESVYNCQYCDKVFTSSGDFKKHLSQHTHKRPYMCGHCSKSFRDPNSLVKHERIHTGEQPYICTDCGRGFAEKSSLRKHARIHSGEKPYKCDQCDKSFSISGNLKRHVLIHSGKRPFKCTICNKSFNNQSHLRRHIKNLHAKEEKEAVVPRELTDEEDNIKIDQT